MLITSIYDNIEVTGILGDFAPSFIAGELPFNRFEGTGNRGYE
jgi:hypothetical protein